MSGGGAGSRVLAGVLFGAMVAGAWVVSPALPTPARALVVFLVTVLPALMLLQGRMMRGVAVAELPRGSVYLSSSVSLWALAALTLGAAWSSGFTPADLGFVVPPLPVLLAWTLGTTLAGLGMLAAARALRVDETETLEHLLPRTGGERIAFVGVSITAGVCEEFVFRAFLIPALAVVLGGTGAAVAVSSLVFGFLHGYQGAIGIVRTAALGLLLALPLLATGSILPSMIVHAALDLIVGLWLADWLLRR